MENVKKNIVALLRYFVSISFFGGGGGRECNFVKIPGCQGKFVPINQQLPKKCLRVSKLSTGVSKRISKAGRCAPGRPYSEGRFAGSAMRLLPPPPSCLSPAWVTSATVPGKNSFRGKMEREFGLQDTAQIQAASKGTSVLVKRSQCQRVLQALFRVT